MVVCAYIFLLKMSQKPLKNRTYYVKINIDILYARGAARLIKRLTDLRKEELQNAGSLYKLTLS
jgi:hypothetical protein